ncbi:transposase, partial [Enterococcus innesii]|uniref:transposase n=1 Tax=Enterococcus innesii TaxID=2839759 RepID=UPI0032E47F50
SSFLLLSFSIILPYLIVDLKLCNRTIIRIFPNQTSANRLIGAVLMDLHDEWIYSSRKYINFDK